MARLPGFLWQVSARAATTVDGDRIRILAYHGVEAPETFARHVERIRDYFTPVDAELVVAALRGETTLSPDAVWITFDDGDATVVEHGLPALIEHDVRATMFVCPGLIESREPFWWDIAHQAERLGLAADVGAPDDIALATWLKEIDDEERRSIVESLEGELRRADALPAARQLTPEHLDRWQQAGQSLGNHTWDHPCLDRCAPDVQRMQVRRAAEWLDGAGQTPAKLFAYPNGNSTPAVETELEDLGYELALAFDHRLTSLHGDRYGLSRLRISSTASDERQLAILTGAHAMAYHARRRVGRRPPDTGLRTNM